MEIAEAPRKRRRPPKACEQCRKRKVRCDQNTPCNQCVRLKIVNCSYDPQTLLKRAANPSYRRTTSGLIVGAPPTPNSTFDQDGVGRRTDPAVFSGSSSTIRSPLNARLEDSPYSHQPHHDKSELLENQVLHVTQHNMRGAQPPNAPPFEHRVDLHGTVTKTRLLGRSHWVNIVQEFPFIAQMQQMLMANEGSDVRLLLDRCKILGRDIKNQIQSEFKVLPNVRSHVPPRELADSLVDNYFRVFESCYRILHISSFRREYDQYWRMPDSASPLFVMKLLLVLAIGTCVCDDESIHHLHNSALQWINAAHSWLSSPFTEKARVSVSGIQIFCLSLIARETCSVSPDLVWISAGSLLRTAMLTGLHRDPSHFSRLTPLQAELRRRLWATVMELCLQSAMNAGGSPLVSVDMHDCRPPANLDDEDMTEDDNVMATAREDNVFTRTSLQIALLQTMTFRCQIAKMLNDFRNEQTFADTLQLDSKLGGKLNQLSSRLKSSRATSRAVTSDTDLKMYELMTYRFLMSLHQTFAIMAMADPVYYFSRKVCLDTSLRLMIAAFSPSSGPSSNTEFTQILEVGSGTVKNTIMVAFLMAGLELVTQSEEGHSGSASIASDMLRREIFRLLTEYNQYTLHRVQKGETNVKGFLFSAVGLAYFKSLEAGGAGDSEAIEAGTRSLNIATEILQKRLNESTAPKAHVASREDDYAGDEFGITFGDDLGWDDWDSSSNFLAMDSFLPQPGGLL